MKLTFLGTAGPDQIPSPFCDCRTCTYARNNRGRDLRKRCSYVINDDLLVDMGADLYVACAMYDISLMNTQYILVTHGHHDHFYAENIKLRKLGFHNYDVLPELEFVAPPSVMTLLDVGSVKDKEIGLKRKPVQPFDTFSLGSYSVTALKATHMPQAGDAVNYLIDDGEKKILIASDTAIYEYDVWTYLQDAQLDLLIIECAVGVNVDFKAGQTRHLSINGVETMVQKMKQINAITQTTKIYVTHFTHKHCLPHDEMNAIFKEIDDAQCAYDGLKLEI